MTRRKDWSLGSLSNNSLNTTILNWLLVNAANFSNIPIVHLACEALYHGNKPVLVLAEAKTYVNESMLQV
jgi:hypothetical protein